VLFALKCEVFEDRARASTVLGRARGFVSVCHSQHFPKVRLMHEFSQGRPWNERENDVASATEYTDGV